MSRAIALAPVLLLAAWLRFEGLDWDQRQHLHPDERFLTMLGVDAKLPESVGAYLDPERSTLNPYNLGRDFFVYGALPLAVNEVLVTLLDRDAYTDYDLVGRALSATLDVLTTLLVFLLAQQLERVASLDSRAKYAAALAYAVSVLPIQNAHFFTVDAPAVFLSTAACWFGLRFFASRAPLALAGAALCFGLALGAKLSALAVLPLLVAFIGFDPQASFAHALRPATLGRRLGWCAGFALASYLVLRLADPHLFASANPLDPRLAARFLANLAQLRAASDPNALYPPALQWIDRTPVWFAVQNLACFGLGIPLFLLAAAGVGLFAARGPFALRLIGLWALAFFLYQSTRFVHTMRYFYVLYPFLAVAAGHGACVIGAALRDRGLPLQPLAAIGLVLVMLWPLAFRRIYARPHARVSASRWLLANAPEHAVIAGEHWDDLLPLPLGGQPVPFDRRELPVFLPDDDAKWRRMNAILAAADYVVLSSNRGYGSIGRLPGRFPRMAALYQSLFESTGDFRLVAEFGSDPELFGLRIDDQWAEEAFTVYDHPKVSIFARRRPR